MPFRSEKQRRFMWARHPEIARRWTDEYGSKPRKKTLSELMTERDKKRGR